MKVPEFDYIRRLCGTAVPGVPPEGLLPLVRPRLGEGSTYNSRVALEFFLGKGGVGKTTLAAAYAVRAARRSRRPVLLISTDPAHSIADVLNVRLGDRPRALLPSLFVWQVNAEKEFRSFLDRYREQIVTLVESGTVFTRREIEPLLDTTLPGMAEIAALLAIHRALTSGTSAQIIVDTAPAGHTLRLFEMPEHFARFLDFLDVAASRDQVLAETFGGSRRVSHPFLAEWRRMVEDVRRALRSEDSRLVLVTTPEEFALNESVRVRDALASSETELKIGAVVLNRAVRGVTRCALCARRARATKSGERFIRRHFRSTDLFVGEDSGQPVQGSTALLAFAQHVFDGRKLRLPLVVPKLARPPRLVAAQWPRRQTPLTLTSGKGGVGKTTISAALAFRQRAESGKPVSICSTDPAPSLDDIFQTEVGDRPVSVLRDRGLRAIEIDSVAHFRAWAAEMRDKIEAALSGEQRGVHVDLSFERRVFSALLDIVPPGVDEIFAIFRILDLVAAGEDMVVIDMAPTGHALELLRMPDRLLLWSRLLLKTLAPHRTLPLAQDLAVEIATVGQRVRELVTRLKDSREALLVPVMLAEPMPDRETERLLAALEEIGAHAAPLFVNRVLLPGQAGPCRRCERTVRWQQATLAAVARRRRGRALYVVPEFGREIAGQKDLQRFTRKLWRIE